MDKETSKVIHEGCEEFGRMLREQLQEFVRLLSMRYQFNIPAEFFNKSEGSGVNNHNSKGASLEEESADGKQLDHSSTCTDELAREQATSVGGPFLGPDIGVGIPPQIPNLLKAENQQRLDQVLDSSHAAKEARIKQSRLEQPYMCSKETVNEEEEVLRLEEVSIKMKSAVVTEKLEEEMGFQDTTTERVQQKNKSTLGELIAENKIQSCREEWRTVAAEGKLKEAAEKVKSSAVENKTAVVLLVPTPASQFGNLSPLLKERVMTRRGVAANQSLHQQVVVGDFAEERSPWLVRNTLTAFGKVCLLVFDGDTLLKGGRGTTSHFPGLPTASIEEAVRKRIDADSNQPFPADESERAMENVLGLQKLVKLEPSKLWKRRKRQSGSFGELAILGKFFKLQPSKLWKKRKKHSGSCGMVAFLGDKKCF